MNIEQMKFIDKQIGVPVCFILSLWNALAARFASRLPDPSSARRILFLKPAEMGTSVILYPTIQKTKEMFPGAELFFVTFEENAEIFKILQIIPEKNILKIRTDSLLHFFGDNLRILSFLRRIKLDMVIDLEFFSRYSAIFSYFTGACFRSGFHRFNSEGLYRGELMTHKVAYNYYQHIGQSFMSLLLALKRPPGRITLQEPMPMAELKIGKIVASEMERLAILKKLRDINAGISERSTLILISPNTGHWLPYRKWPIEYYAELCRKLLERDQDHFVVIVGTRSAREDAAYLMRKVAHPRLIDMVCQTTLKEFFALLNVAKVIVSVDSGPAHFACLTSIGIVCIFGPDTKAVFAPLSERAVSLECDLACHPCFSAFNARTPNCQNAAKLCLESISVDRVFQKVCAFL